MKDLIIYTSLLLFFSCGINEESKPSKTAQIVAESFYQGDETTLKEYTTEEGYANFKILIAMFAKSKNTDSDFKVLEETVEGQVAWVKYSTSYDKTPGIFKLLNENGVWKVTARRPGEKGPF
ncbi:hypothetical protein [Leeuwenhoekiella sp. NPDC079379]|uniref:hypothetical protein n=1 Tax=Leeuwenhoekiella sp. NPDC079379 TaxID=3364122 RepID=UPI0037C99C4F